MRGDEDHIAFFLACRRDDPFVRRAGLCDQRGERYAGRLGQLRDRGDMPLTGFAGGALTLPLALGPNVFTLGLEVGGTVFQLSFTLFRVDALGEVRITSPGEGSLLNTPTVTVRGTAPRGTPLVEVNGIPAAIGADGVSFEAADVPIREGSNPLRAIAYPLGREALVTVTGDFTPPRFLAFVPEDGTATTAPEVTLAGFLSEGGSLELEGPGGEVAGSLTRLSTVTLLNVTAGGGSTVPVFVIDKR